MAETKIAYLLLIFATIFAMSRCENHLLFDKLRTDFMWLEGDLWKFVLWSAPSLSRAAAEVHVIKKFNSFDRALQQMPEDILRGLEPIRQIHAFLFLYSEVKHTEHLYEKFRRFQNDQMRNNYQDFNDKSPLDPSVHIEDIIRDILNPTTGANATVHKVYDLTFGKENMAMEIIDLIVGDYQCKGYSQSPQQVYYNLYNALALNGLKSYAMLQFAYLIRRISEKGNYTDLSEITRVQFEKRVNETMSVFRGAMEIVSPATWQCDPKNHVKGKTYEEFTRLIQGHIQNEVDMNSGGTCLKNCEAYPMSTSHGCYDSESKYCKEMERCDGKIMNCRFVESHMEICPSKISSRRYDYIQYESGNTMGKKKVCWKKPINSWWRWFVRCSYCLCLCDEQGPKSDRYINIRPVLANINDNRVVTGVRFVKHNRVMHLQIQEGKLLPYGYIDNATVRWVPVDDYKITDKGVYNGKDYYTMTSDNRDMALDDVEINQENYVVTGARFQFIDGKIRFQIHVSTFNWDTGTLSQKNGNYIYRVNGGKNKIDLNKVDLPTISPPSEINYNSDLYVQFTHTDFAADAAQTTVPFVDIQPVSNNPQVPLKGVGIYYKGNEGFGGFIAPKIITYDYSKLILVRFASTNERFEPVPPYDVAPN